MRKRLSYYILFLVVLCMAAVPALPQVKGAAVSHEYDPVKNTVTLHVTNTRGRDITAYNIKIKETYGQKVREHDYSTDTLGIVLNIQEWVGTDRGEQLRAQFGNGTLQAGASRDEVQHVQPGLTNYEATVDTVIYSDKTAETTNQDALDRALSFRKSEVSTLQTTNDIIKKAMANTQDPAPNETAAKEIEQVQQTWETQHHAGNLNAGALHAVILELRNAPAISAHENKTLRPYLNEYLTKKNERVSALLEHAAPKVGAQ